MHAVTKPLAPFSIAGGALEVHMVPSVVDNLIWVLVGQGEAAVVDGPPDAAGVLDLCENLGVKLTTVLNTHTHWDHIGINQDLEKRGLLSGLRVFGPAAKASEVPGITDPVGEGDTVTFAGATAQVWLTEGHLDGHVSFVFDGAVFCGDTMFAGGCGYLFDGPPTTMARSLQRLCTLPPDTRVCCAHEYTEDNLAFALFVEPDNAALQARVEAVRTRRADGHCTVPSTIAEEQATNPFVRAGSPGLVARVAELGDLASTDYDTVFAATRELKNAKVHKA